MKGLEALDIIAKNVEIKEEKNDTLVRNAHIVVEKELKALEVLKELLLLEVREIGGKYYIKYRNLEEDNYIDYEISEELYEVLKWNL